VRLENWPDFRPALKASDLIPGLKNPDPSVRASCAIALEKFDKREVSGPLIAALEKEEEKWPRRQMTLALLWLKTEAPESLCRWLLETETDPEIRELVRGLMKNSGYKFDRKDIEKGLADGKHPDDIGKWLDLAAKKQAKEFVPLIATLARRGEGNFVRTAATSALGNFNLPDSKKTLRELLATAADAAVRSRAANSLGKLKDIEAEDVLIKALRSDSDGGVRIAAAAALGSLGTMKAENALITGFQKEGETDYIDALVAVSSLRAREALAEKLARMESLGLAAGRKPGDYRILFALAHGLLEMNDMRGMEVMARWLEPRFPEELRVSVIEVLDDTKDALPLIRRYANDESRNVRTAVIRAISKGATGDGPIM
jgi:HEAT repeat protein